MMCTVRADTLKQRAMLMSGAGAVRPALERRAQELGSAEYVTFPGALQDSDLPREFDAAHLFCLLSPRASRGCTRGIRNRLVEAGAHGLPVVGGRIPGVEDAVEDEVNGILIDPTDPDAAMAAIERVLVDQENGQRLADGGLRRASELQWLKVFGRYRVFFEGVLASPRRGRSTRKRAWIAALVRGPR